MKRVRIAIVVVLVALAGVMGWQVAQSDAPEPVYKGRTLTTWLRILSHPSRSASPPFAEAREAVRQIGTNGIPTLLRLLRAKDSALKLKLMGLVQRQKLIKVQFTPAEELNALSQYGFFMLGTNAQTAAPELIDIAKQDISRTSQMFAVASLRNIGDGPTAKQAVPYLLQQLYATNLDAAVRWYVRLALYKVDPEVAAKAGITNNPLLER